MQDGDDTLAGRDSLHGPPGLDSAPGTGDDTVAGEPAQTVGRRIGDLVGRYVLLERIGAGGMGVVHRAYDPDLDRHVALKLLRAGARVGAPESSRLRLLREAQALAKLSHDNVVAVFDVGTTADEVFLAMELVEGIDLSSRLKGDDKPGWRDAVRILAAAGSGLAAAHDLGLVHRDFKPGNVLLARGGGVLVTDFGLARVDEAARSDSSHSTGSYAPVHAGGPRIEEVRAATSGSAWLEVDLTVEGALMGTPGYMAPEQHRGVPADARADQYAFTTTLWESIYGARPFTNGTPDELAIRKTGGPPPCPARPAVPAWLRRVLQRGLAADPNARFVDMHALLAALERGPRRRRVAVVVGALGLAAIGAIALAVRAGHRPDPCPMPSADTDAAFARWSRVREEIGDHEIASRIDDVLTQRGAALHDACRATFVLGERSRQWFGDRERCADRQAVVLAAVFARLPTAGPHAAAIVDTIPASDDCEPLVVAESASSRLADADVLLASGEIAAALGRIGDIESGLDDDASILADSLRARASWALGDRSGAEERLLDAVARARGTGRARLEARLWLDLGRLALEDGRLARAALVVDFAAAAADASRGADERADVTDERAHPLAAEIARVQREVAVARGEPTADAATQ